MGDNIWMFDPGRIQSKWNIFHVPPMPNQNFNGYICVHTCACTYTPWYKRKSIGLKIRWILFKPLYFYKPWNSGP